MWRTAERGGTSRAVGGAPLRGTVCRTTRSGSDCNVLEAFTPTDADNLATGSLDSRYRSAIKPKQQQQQQQQQRQRSINHGMNGHPDSTSVRTASPSINRSPDNGICKTSINGTKCSNNQRTTGTSTMPNLKTPSSKYPTSTYSTPSKPTPTASVSIKSDCMPSDSGDSSFEVAAATVDTKTRLINCNLHEKQHGVTDNSAATPTRLSGSKVIRIALFINNIL